MQLHTTPSTASGHYLSSGRDEHACHFHDSGPPDTDWRAPPPRDSRPPLDALLLEALSRRMLRHMPQAWGELFGEGAVQQPRFEVCERTLLHADITALRAAADEPLDLEWLVRCHHGQLEPSEPGQLLVGFQDPRDALGLALSLFRCLPGLRVRVGLAGGRCVQAVFWSQGERHTLALGRSVRQAALAASLAAPGSIVLGDGMHDALPAAMDQELKHCLVIEEFEADRLQRVTITPAPARGAAQSSFAGLGLS